MWNRDRKSHGNSLCVSLNCFGALEEEQEAVRVERLWCLTLSKTKTLPKNMSVLCYLFACFLVSTHFLFSVAGSTLKHKIAPFSVFFFSKIKLH